MSIWQIWLFSCIWGNSPGFPLCRLRSLVQCAGFAGGNCQWDYILRVIVDPREGGEWFNELLEDGTSLRKPVVEEWKCPYHNGRMCLRMIGAEIPEEL